MSKPTEALRAQINTLLERSGLEKEYPVVRYIEEAISDVETFIDNLENKKGEAESSADYHEGKASSADQAREEAKQHAAAFTDHFPAVKTQDDELKIKILANFHRNLNIHQLLEVEKEIRVNMEGKYIEH
jgi:hypothetical protein